MSKIDVITIKGEKKGTVDFGFDGSVSDLLVSSVARSNMANKRQSIANTKDRSEVRGGGKKPWRQKGSGRARHGSSRSPIWVGGGVTFGPTSRRNFSKTINRKQKTLVLARLFLEKIKDKKIKILEEIKIEDGKTKSAFNLLSSLGIDKEVVVLLDVELMNSEEGGKIHLAFSNLPLAQVYSIDKINAFLLMKNEWIIITKNAFEHLNKRIKKHEMVNKLKEGGIEREKVTKRTPKQDRDKEGRKKVK